MLAYVELDDGTVLTLQEYWDTFKERLEKKYLSDTPIEDEDVEVKE